MIAYKTFEKPIKRLGGQLLLPEREQLRQEVQQFVSDHSDMIEVINIAEMVTKDDVVFITIWYKEADCQPELATAGQCEDVSPHERSLLPELCINEPLDLNDILVEMAVSR